MPTDIEPVDAFAYPLHPHVWRHGPSGYTDYRSYRPWLRDEFTFRCVYCLIREQWGRVSGEFDLDHFVPQTRTDSLPNEYENLRYACHTCNLRKGDDSLPDPSQSFVSDAVRVYPDGTIVGMTDDAERLIWALCLNSSAYKRWRRMWIRIIELALEGDQQLLHQLLGYPDDLPNLKACRAPQNSRPEGVEQSCFARRERGELSVVYLATEEWHSR